MSPVPAVTCNPLGIAWPSPSLMRELFLSRSKAHTTFQEQARLSQPVQDAIWALLATWIQSTVSLVWRLTISEHWDPSTGLGGHWPQRGSRVLVDPSPLLAPASSVPWSDP